MPSSSLPGAGLSPWGGLHPFWLFMQRMGHAALPLPMGTVLPMPLLPRNPQWHLPLSPCSCLMPFSPSQNSSTQVLSLIVSWGFISSCQGLLLGVTAVQVWLPCRVYIKEHTLLLIFLILSHGLRPQAASPLYSRALCLPRHSRVPETEPS